MIETTTTADPKIICSAVHLSKKIYTKRHEHIITKENQRKRCQCKFLKVYSSKNINVSRYQTAKKPQINNSKKKKEKANYIYQQYQLEKNVK